MHGGPAAALLAREIERLPAPVPMAVVRVTVDILRPVPLQPLSVSARVERPGRRVQLVSAVLTSDGPELCRATAWRVRELPAGSVRPTMSTAVAAPESVPAHEPESDLPGFHRTGVELRFVRGSFYALGPSTVWIKLRRPVVDAETPSPLMRVMSAADFGNGVSAELEFGSNLFINTDVSVYLDRPPVGAWVCLDAQTMIGPGGAGIAESALYDVEGRIGRSLQALLVGPAGPGAGGFRA
jgi:hypothetical protein